MGVAEGVASTVESVGSCASLVTEILVTDGNYELGPDLATLLVSAILLDTGNLQLGHVVKDKDKEMAEQLLKLLPEDFDAQAHYDCLSKARRDISKLSTPQVLGRDYKQSFVSDKFCIGFSTITAELGAFVTRDNFTEELNSFYKKHSLHVLLLLGAYPADGDHGNWRRQIAVCRCEEGGWSDLADSIGSMLEAHDELKCTRVLEGQFDGLLLEQDNTTLSRKHILPLVVQFVSDA